MDDYHGEALVPLADVFNHKAALVDLAEGYQTAEQAGRGEGGVGTALVDLAEG